MLAKVAFRGDGGHTGGHDERSAFERNGLGILPAEGKDIEAERREPEGEVAEYGVIAEQVCDKQCANQAEQKCKGSVEDQTDGKETSAKQSQRTSNCRRFGPSAQVI